MGGNALKHYETTRLPKDDYFVLVAEFSQKFMEVFGFDPILIKAYKNKPSFGDADFLINSDKLPSNWIFLLKEAFCLTDDQYIKNSNVVSIGYNNFQIDLIVTLEDELESAQFYFAYNDFGNLIGRIGHKLGVKIGHKGLSLVVRHENRRDHILKEIWLSTNSKDCLELLGLDIEQYEQGFDELEDVFKYIASSKYFDPEIFSLEHRSATSRRRDAKRVSYNKFLRWVAETKPELKHSFAEKSELGGYSIRLPYYLTEVLPRWPWVDSEIKLLMNDFELDLEFKKVYNGEVVSELTGYAGKTLGAFMNKMKPTLTQETKRKWIESENLLRLNIAQLWLDLGGVNFKAVEK